jgi:hypothetical protein
MTAMISRAPGASLATKIGKHHRLAAQGVDDMPVIDDMAAPVFAIATAARQGHQMRGPEEELEPVVVQSDQQPVTDQPRRYGVEDPLEDEAAR